MGKVLVLELRKSLPMNLTLSQGHQFANEMEYHRHVLVQLLLLLEPHNLRWGAKFLQQVLGNVGNGWTGWKCLE